MVSKRIHRKKMLQVDVKNNIYKIIKILAERLNFYF